jgi:serine/threonine-protein kinase RsbW
MQDYGTIQETNQRTFAAKFSSLEKIRAYIRLVSRNAGFSQDKIYKITLSVDEACSNIIEHAYRGESDNHHIDCVTCITTEALLVQLHDTGRSFDPEAIPEPRLEADIDERARGGLGLFLIRKFMDELAYQNKPFFSPDGNSSQDGNFLLLVKYKFPITKG